MPVLRDLTSGAYVLDSGHEEESYEGFGVVPWSATATRPFSTRSSVTKAIHAFSLAGAGTVPPTDLLLQSRSEQMFAW